MGEGRRAIHAVTAAAVGKKSITYIAIDAAADATKAMRILKTLA